jgi:hypothetical protein
MPNDMRDIALPEELCKAVERRFGARFGSLPQFLVFVMQELLHDEAGQMDEAERRMVEQRLKDLGYM